MAQIAIVGGGLAGLSCAVDLADAGCGTTLFEAAPRPGGRTRSFHDRRAGGWVDNGPHLLIGAYRETASLLAHVGAADHIHWQRRLRLPLWDERRGHFAFAPSAHLPFPLALLAGVARLPGHGGASLAAMARLGRAARRGVEPGLSVARWLAQLRAPERLTRDLVEPLCLGAMNEPPGEADAASFARVLREAFADAESARLGWFTLPLQQGLVKPLADHARRRGATIRCGARVRGIETDGAGAILRLGDGESERFDAAVLAVPVAQRDRMLGARTPVRTRSIANVHLWFDAPVQLPDPFVGGIGTTGQWFFDVTAQMGGCPGALAAHLCAVSSADAAATPAEARVARIRAELEAIVGRPLPEPVHQRVVRERHATATVQPTAAPALPVPLVDAAELPLPGELPATIETAVRRGRSAARTALRHLERENNPLPLL